MATLVRALAVIILSLQLSFGCLPAVVVPSGAPASSCFTAREISRQQAPSTGGFTIRSVTTLVTVDAVVRTDKGGFVGDLQAGDFAVYDNGVLQEITLFSRELLPLAVALVVDRSPSVQPYLAQLRSAALTTLERLKPEDEVALFAFDMNPGQFSELTRDREHIAQMVTRFSRGVGTNIYDALFDAVAYLRLKAPDRRRAIILISDNYQSIESAYGEREVLQEMLESAAVLYSIKTRGDNPQGSSFGTPGSIARFAGETGGEVLEVDSANRLVTALDAALLNLKHGYVLGFSPSDAGREGDYHRLAVKLRAPERCPTCRIQARTGYYAGAQPAPALRSLPRAAPRSRLAGVKGIDVEELIAQQRIAAARDHDADLQEIVFSASAAESQDEKGRPQVRVELRIDAAGVLFRIAGDRHEARLRITVFCLDPKGKSLGADWKIMDLHLKDDTFREVQKSGISYTTAVPLKTKARKIKVVVFDPWSNRLGSRTVQMD